VPKLTADDWQQRVLAECGRPVLEAQGEDAFTKALLDGLQNRLRVLWDMEAGRPTAYLRYLVTKLAGVDHLLGQFYRYTDVRLGRFGPSSSQSQIFKNLQALRKETSAQVLAAEKQAALSGVGGAGGPSAGVLTRTAPYMPSTDGVPDGTDGAGNVDPGSPVYGGWPLPGGRWRGWGAG
jgi:hypothetical protein